eukprot:6205408-Pleurochrysis_carterae.AAC.2
MPSSKQRYSTFECIQNTSKYHLMSPRSSARSCRSTEPSILTYSLLLVTLKSTQALPGGSRPLQLHALRDTHLYLTNRLRLLPPPHSVLLLATCSSFHQRHNNPPPRSRTRRTYLLRSLAPGVCVRHYANPCAAVLRTRPPAPTRGTQCKCGRSTNARAARRLPCSS